MGWAQRAKRKDRAAGKTTRCGNPAPFQPTATVISDAKYKQARAVGASSFPVAFSDRRYSMDTHGTLRRVSSVPTATITHA